MEPSSYISEEETLEDLDNMFGEDFIEEFFQDSSLDFVD